MSPIGLEQKKEYSIGKLMEVEYFYDHIALVYDDSWKQEPLSKYVDALKWHLIEKALPPEPNGKILELGGGTGHWTIPLAKSGHPVTMVEISSGMLSVAREKVKAEGLENSVQFHHRDMTKLDDFPSGNFALVLTTGGSLNYCRDYRHVIGEMRRLCRSGGYVFVDPTSRFYNLPHLLRNRDFETVYELVRSGNTHVEFQGVRVWRHDFEIRELLTLLREEGLMVSTMVGNSILAGTIGEETTLKMLEELGGKRLIEMEEFLSRYENLMDRAQIFEVLCQVR